MEARNNNKNTDEEVKKTLDKIISNIETRDGFLLASADRSVNGAKFVVSGYKQLENILKESGLSTAHLKQGHAKAKQGLKNAIAHKRTVASDSRKKKQELNKLKRS